MLGCLQPQHTQLLAWTQQIFWLMWGCVSASPSVPLLYLSYHLTHTHVHTHTHSSWIYTYIWDSLCFYNFHSKHSLGEISPAWKSRVFSVLTFIKLETHRYSCTVNLQKAALRNIFSSGRGQMESVMWSCFLYAPIGISCRSPIHVLNHIANKMAKQIADLTGYLHNFSLFWRNMHNL